MSTIVPGVCRHCGCTDEQGCRLHRHAADDFAWTDRQRLVCNGRECQREEAARVRKARAPRPGTFAYYAALGWERGAILTQLAEDAKQRRRQASRGKGRAA